MTDAERLREIAKRIDGQDAIELLRIADALTWKSEPPDGKSNGVIDNLAVWCVSGDLYVDDVNASQWFGPLPEVPR